MKKIIKKKIAFTDAFQPKSKSQDKKTLTDTLQPFIRRNTRAELFA